MMMRRAFFVLLVAALAGAGCSRRETNPYVGTWVLKYHGRNLLSLSFEKRGDVLQGTWTRPRTFNYDQDGDFTAISSDHKTEPLKEIAQDGSSLRFAVGSGKDADQFVMRLVDADHAAVRYVDEPAPPWRLQRVARPEDARLDVRWPDPPAPPDVVALRSTLKRMYDEDQAPRREFSLERMKSVDAAHRAEVLRIFQQYGWPKVSVFGKEAVSKFFILAQHEPPDVQRMLLPALNQAVEMHEAPQSDYTYLYDKLMVNEGKAQHWGNSVNCVKGKAVLAPVDDPAGLAARRAALYLPPVEDLLRASDPSCAAVK